MKRYIEMGIANFLCGRYPKGCLLGYVLNGESAKVVDMINQGLTSANREKEILQKDSNYGIDFHYVSSHVGTSMPLLKHFLLNLS
jgi:hypothetical protein